MNMHPLRHGAVALALLGAAPALFAHGLISDPPSRNWFCGVITKPDEVANNNAVYPICGDAFANDWNGGYQFMSVLTHTQGRKVVRPLPEHVCGFGSETWNGGETPWDQPIDWPTNEMRPGENTITWDITWGPHWEDTEDFRYWITKPDFEYQVGRPLSWDDFEAEPFCDLPYDPSNPNANPAVVPVMSQNLFHTTCDVPARSGRHVIYAEWGRNEWTYERFHGCVDVQFAGHNGGGGGDNGPGNGGDNDPEPSVLDAVLTLSPDVSVFIGAGSIALDATGSVGEIETYLWSVDAPDNTLYTLENADQPAATLHMADPGATADVRIRLTVTRGDTSATAVRTLRHQPESAGGVQLTDLGPLTREGRTLKAGDRVSVRLVTSTGRDVYVPATPLVLTASNAGADRWPVALAERIAADNAGVSIGVLMAEGGVAPVVDAVSNRIYVDAALDYGNAYLHIEPADTTDDEDSNDGSDGSDSGSGSKKDNNGGALGWWMLLGLGGIAAFRARATRRL